MCASTMADHADKQALLEAFKMRIRSDSYASCGSGKHMGKAKAHSLDPGKVVHYVTPWLALSGQIRWHLL